MEKNPTAQSQTVQDSVYTALRKSIMSLNLAPGTAISENEISQRYEVSRTPVREALIHLSKEGLVQVIPQRETLVSRIDFRRVKQEWFLRESLESAAQNSFIKHSTPAHFAELERLIEQQNAAQERNEYGEFVNLDDCFHRIFFEVADQLLAWQVLDSMGGHYHRVRILTTLLKGIAPDIIVQHKRLLETLRQKDLAGAQAALAAHLHKLPAEEDMLREKFPDYFVSCNEKDVFNVDFGGLPNK
ncbi:GntR family transcriptional regulator [Spirochaetia bacterium]|nr:GntR family transcriptional regulator [Spirochaetia bacterium]